MTACDVTSEGRREFLRYGLQIAGGLAAASLLGRSVTLAAENDRFELSIHQYSLKKLLDEGSLDTAAYPGFVKREFGIMNVEFAVEFCQSLWSDPTQGDTIRKTSQANGIKHRALLCGAEPALDVASEQDRQAAVDGHVKWAEVAKHLGCEYLRVRASTEGDRSAQLDFAAQGIGALCDALNGTTLSVLIENVAGFSRDPDWLVDLVERVGPERVGLIADFGNFDGDIYQGMAKLLPYTKSVCTKSWKFDDRGNETTIDFARMMNVIKASPFRGCIAIEYLGDDPVDGVRKTAELIRQSS